MKKCKALLLTAVLAFSVLGLTGCGGGGAKHIDINLENPIQECSSLDEMNSLAGTDIPDLKVVGGTDESYRIISVFDNEDKTDVAYVIAECDFNINGESYTLRSSLEEESDISGVYINATPAYDSMATETIEYKGTGNILVSRWSTDGYQVVLMRHYDAETTPEDEAAFHSVSEDLSLAM